MNGTFETITAAAAAAKAKTLPAEYQRKRLWCGITGIGLILVALWTAYALGLAGALDSTASGFKAFLQGMSCAMYLGFAAILLQLPVDIVACKIEKRFGQRADPSGPLLPKGYWIQTCFWWIGLSLAGQVYSAAYVYGGKYWPLWAAGGWVVLSFLGAVCAISPASIVALPKEKAAWWEEVATELRRTGVYVPKAIWYSHGETSLAGGWTGVGPWRKLLMASTLWDVRPRIAAALISREQGHLELGHRLASAAVSVVWVAFGVMFAARLTPPGMGAAGAVFIAATVMSTWCWIGLLGLLPWLGRRQIYEADAFLIELEFTKEEVAETLATLARANKPDESLPAGIAAIFHPIPTMSQRRQRLGIQ